MADVSANFVSLADLAARAGKKPSRRGRRGSIEFASMATSSQGGGLQSRRRRRSSVRPLGPMTPQGKASPAATSTPNNGPSAKSSLKRPSPVDTSAPSPDTPPSDKPVVVEAALKLLSGSPVRKTKKEKRSRPATAHTQRRKSIVPFPELKDLTLHDVPVPQPLKDKYNGQLQRARDRSAVQPEPDTVPDGQTPRDTREAWEKNKRFLSGLNHEAIHALRKHPKGRTSTEAAIILAWLKAHAQSEAASPLFRSLFELPYTPDEDVHALCDSMRVVSFVKGSLLFAQGTVAKHAYFILNGHVHVYHRLFSSNAKAAHEIEKGLKEAEMEAEVARTAGRRRSNAHRRRRGLGVAEVQHIQALAQRRHDISADTGAFVGCLGPGAPVGWSSSWGNVHDITAISGGDDGDVEEANLFPEAQEAVATKFMQSLRVPLLQARREQASELANRRGEGEELGDVVDALRVDVAAYLKCSRRWLQREQLMLRRRATLLRRLAVLQDLPACELMFMAQWLKERRYKRGTIMQSEGEAATHVTFVLTGAVGLYAWERGPHTAGTTLCVHIEHVAAPAMYGEACHVLRATRTTTRSEHGYVSERQVNAAKALGDVLVGTMPTSAFRAMCLSEPSAALFRARRRLLILTLQRDEWREMRVHQATTTGEMAFPLLSHIQDLVIKPQNRADVSSRPGGKELRRGDRTVLKRGVQGLLGSDSPQNSDPAMTTPTNRSGNSAAEDAAAAAAVAGSSSADLAQQVSKAYEKAGKVRMYLMRFIIAIKSSLAKKRAQAKAVAIAASVSGRAPSTSKPTSQPKPARKGILKRSTGPAADAKPLRASDSFLGGDLMPASQEATQRPSTASRSRARPRTAGRRRPGGGTTVGSRAAPMLNGGGSGAGSQRPSTTSAQRRPTTSTQRTVGAPALGGAKKGAGFTRRRPKPRSQKGPPQALANGRGQGQNSAATRSPTTTNIVGLSLPLRGVGFGGQATSLPAAPGSARATSDNEGAGRRSTPRAGGALEPPTPGLSVDTGAPRARRATPRWRQPSDRTEAGSGASGGAAGDPSLGVLQVDVSPVKGDPPASSKGSPAEWSPTPLSARQLARQQVLTSPAAASSSNSLPNDTLTPARSPVAGLSPALGVVDGRPRRLEPIAGGRRRGSATATAASPLAAAKPLPGVSSSHGDSTSSLGSTPGSKYRLHKRSPMHGSRGRASGSEGGGSKASGSGGVTHSPEASHSRSVRKARSVASRSSKLLQQTSEMMRRIDSHHHGVSSASLAAKKSSNHVHGVSYGSVPGVNTTPKRSMRRPMVSPVDEDVPLDATGGSDSPAPPPTRTVSFAVDKPQSSETGLQTYIAERAKEAKDLKTRASVRSSSAFLRTDTALSNTLPHENAAFRRVFTRYEAGQDSPARQDVPDRSHGRRNSGLDNIGEHVEVQGEVDSDDDADTQHNGGGDGAHSAAWASNGDVAEHRGTHEQGEDGRTSSSSSLRRISTANRLLEDQAQQQQLAKQHRHRRGRRSRKGSASSRAPAGSAGSSSFKPRPSAKDLFKAALQSQSDLVITDVADDGEEQLDSTAGSTASHLSASALAAARSSSFRRLRASGQRP